MPNKPPIPDRSLFANECRAFGRAFNRLTGPRKEYIAVMCYKALKCIAKETGESAFSAFLARLAVKEMDRVCAMDGVNESDDQDERRDAAPAPSEAPPLIPAKSATPRTINGHILMTPKTCVSRNRVHEEGTCPVCNGGLLVCVMCGKYEAELDEPCEEQT